MTWKEGDFRCLLLRRLHFSPGLRCPPTPEALLPLPVGILCLPTLLWLPDSSGSIGGSGVEEWGPEVGWEGEIVQSVSTYQSFLCHPRGESQDSTVSTPARVPALVGGAASLVGTHTFHT